MAYQGNTPTTQAFTPAVDYFSGNGSTTAFTLSRTVASVAQVEAVIENVADETHQAASSERPSVPTRRTVFEVVRSVEVMSP